MPSSGEREHSAAEGSAVPDGSGVRSSSGGTEAPPASESAEPNSAAANLTRSDERVLEYLADAGADYPALVAGNTGLHVPVVERSIESMTEAGLVERVSDEVVYRITAAGHDAIGR